jgi:hypothetical protein
VFITCGIGEAMGFSGAFICAPVGSVRCGTILGRTNEKSLRCRLLSGDSFGASQAESAFTLADRRLLCRAALFL